MTVHDVSDWAACDDPGPEVQAMLHRIKARQGTRRALDRYHLDLYGGLGYGGYRAQQDTLESFLLDDDASCENVIREVTDTVTAKLLKSPPVPRVVTSDGDWQAQQTAKNLDAWIRGQLDACDWEQELLGVGLLHAVVVGTGCAYIWHDGERLVAEPCPSWELWVDPAEAAYGRPRTMYRERVVPRDVLAARYPDKADQISDGAAWTDHQLTVDYSDSGTDVVLVVEAWRLACGDDPGRYVCCSDGVTLADDEWPHDVFPFAFLRCRRRPVGFWGQGLVEDLAPAQIAMNAAQTARLDAIARMSAGMVFVERGSQVLETQLLSDVNARLLEYVGQPPQFVMPDARSPGLTQQVQEMRAQMYAQGGVSEGSATMQKPSGLDSGKALRTYHDLESERLSQLSKAIERYTVECARLLVRAARDLAENGDGPDSTAVGPGGTRLIKWSDVQLDEESYVITITPASSLATTLAGRVQDVHDLASLGIVQDKHAMLQLLNLPDLERYAGYELAVENTLLWVLEEQILANGRPMSPEPIWPLQQAAALCTQVLMRAERDGAPEDRLALLRSFLAQTQALIRANQPPAPAPGAAAGAIPAGAGAVPDVGAIAGGGVVPLGG